ncbi:hypothetical protein EDD11_009163 [Mortierella claussenii]|nr:hypothetical protein EDD11_009163 [Mortierella claussenii]
MDRPEIRKLLSKVLDMNSMVLCSQLNRAWNAECIPYIWNTIDLDQLNEFLELESHVIIKNGHFIREVSGLRKRSQLDLFDHFNSTSGTVLKDLKGLKIRLRAKSRAFRQRALELVFKNMGTLKNLEIVAEHGFSPETHFDIMLTELSFNKNSINSRISDIGDATIAATGDYTTASEIITGSIGGSWDFKQLTWMSLQQLAMSRATLSTLLRSCPLLEEFDIQQCNITIAYGQVQTHEQEEKLQQATNVNSIISQSKSVTYLWASIEQVFNPEQLEEYSPNVPSLLVHFPALKCWEVWSNRVMVRDPYPSIIRAEIANRCLQFEELSVDDTSSEITCDLFAGGVWNLKIAYFRYETLSPNVISSILVHQKTLTTLAAYRPLSGFSYQAAEIIPLPRQMENGWMVAMVLSRCPHLGIIRLPGHEVEMDFVDQFPWACTSLTELRIRIKGLDRKELIMAVIKRWGCEVVSRRRTLMKKARTTRQETANTASVVEMPANTTAVGSLADDEGTPYSAEEATLVDRVVRHLLQFDSLSVVWLGFKVWTVAVDVQKPLKHRL